MPAGKTRRKDDYHDTWTTEDLTHALKGSKDGGDKKKRPKDDDGKERRRAKDGVNGDGSRKKDDDKKSRKKDEEDRRGKGRSRGDFSPVRMELTEEDRERLRQERREKRGGESKKKEDRPHKDEKAADSEDDAKRRPKREESARRHRKRDDEDDGDRRKRHGDEDGDRKRRRDKESRHGDREDGDHRDENDEERERRRQERRERREKKEEEGDHRNDEDEERERRRQERRERREKKEEDGDRERKHKSKRDHDDDEDREKRHRDKDKDKEERHKDRDKDRDREKEREERRKERERDKEERHKDRKDKDKEREERKRREKEEEEQQKKEEEQNTGGDEEDYNDYDDDFEDYEDDFEDDDDMNEGRRRRKSSPQILTSGKTTTTTRTSFMNISIPANPESDAEGEMEEVLRALDEENARLTSHSQRSNWSDSTELSDERFKEGEGPGSQQAMQDGDRPARPKTFINFVSAKQRVMNLSQASKARRRADDLKNMIELDTVFYDLFDLPPVREYELYIRSFGRSNTKQAYVQTNEDSVERDIQTEETEDMDKWTQHPAEETGSVGGDGISVMSAGEDKASLNNPESLARVAKFAEKAAQVMMVLMEEEKTSEEGERQTRDRTSSISVSEGFSQLGCPSFLAGRRVEHVSFCPMQPNTFLTLHSPPSVESTPENVMSSYGMICVWNVKETASPQKVLTCLSQPTCACFSPSRAALVIAGMRDGSVMLWDLRELSALHRSVAVDDQEITTRFPTYNTAGVLDKENHHSPVTAITAVHPIVVRKESQEENTPADSEGSLSFQLASVDEAATVNLWVVTEIPSPDMAGSEVDLGLAPGGRIKLLRSSAIVLDNPNKLVSSSTLKALDIQLSPSDLNHFFVATDLGQIIHGVRFGSRVFPRVYQPEIDSPKKITCIDFSPFGHPYFLAGCEDGSVHLYHTSQKHPLSSWPMFSEGQAIQTIQWSRSRPAVFFVLAENSTLHTFDLVETGLLPIKSDPISSGRVTAMALGSDPALIGGNKNLPTHLLVALDNGSAELHTISSSLRQQQPLEGDFLAHYTDRF